MKSFRTIVILLMAIAFVFLEAGVAWPRRALGVQIDLLPALAVLAAMRVSLTGVAVFAVVGGLSFDAFSLNPLGVSILPLFLIGVVVQLWQTNVLRETRLYQVVVGFIAGAAAPALTLGLVLTNGRSPLLGWAAVWQWLLMALACGVFTPLLFVFFDWLEQTLTYRPFPRQAFRPDREIRRWRS
jgi:hypothetical protein